MQSVNTQNLNGSVTLLGQSNFMLDYIFRVWRHCKKGVLILRPYVMIDLFCLEFYKDGKYDLDFKNKDSDPSKWVSIVRFQLGYCGIRAKFLSCFLRFMFINFMAKIKNLRSTEFVGTLYCW